MAEFPFSPGLYKLSHQGKQLLRQSRTFPEASLKSCCSFRKILRKPRLDSEPFTHPNVWRPHEAHRNYGNCDYKFASCGGGSRACAAGSNKPQKRSRPKGREMRAAREGAEPGTTKPRGGNTARRAEAPAKCTR